MEQGPFLKNGQSLELSPNFSPFTIIETLNAVSIQANVLLQ